MNIAIDAEHKGHCRGARQSLGILNGHLTVFQERGDAKIARWTTDRREQLAELYREHGYNVNFARLREIEMIIRARYDGPVNTDDGHAYISCALNAKVLAHRHYRWTITEDALVGWARTWTPHVPEDEARALAARVLDRPRRFKGTTVGKGLCLTRAERDALGITTIAPGDTDPETWAGEKADRRRGNKREAAAASRRAQGATPRGESLRALCRSHGLTESHERALRRFRGHLATKSGQEAALEAYLTGHGVDKSACPLFVASLVIDTNIGSEIHPYRVHEKRTPDRAASKRGPATVDQHPEDILDPQHAAPDAPRVDPGYLASLDADALSGGWEPALPDGHDLQPQSERARPQAAPADPPDSGTAADADPDIPAWFLAEIEARRERRHLSGVELATIEDMSRRYHLPPGRPATAATLAQDGDSPRPPPDMKDNDGAAAGAAPNHNRGSKP